MANGWGGARPNPGPKKKMADGSTAKVPIAAAPASTAVLAKPAFKVGAGIAPRIRSIADGQRKQLQMMRKTVADGQRIFAPYKPPAGVVPEDKAETIKLAMDQAPGVVWAAQSYVSASFFSGMNFLGYPTLSDMSQRPEYYKISDRLATEMTRKWIRLVSTGEDTGAADRIEKLEAFLKEIRLREAATDLARKDGFLGRAHLYLDTGDTDDRAELMQPIGNGRNEISKAKVSQKKPLRRVQTVEAWTTYPANYNASDPLKPDWLDPTTWYVMGKEVHRSRVLPFVGREVPDLLKPAYAFGGLSLTQMAQPYVDNWLSTRDHVARLVANFSKNGIKTDLQQMLSPDGTANDGADLMNRIALYTATSDNNGLMVLNKETEEFFQMNTPLGTLDQLQAQAQEQMCLPTGMPVVVFFGLTPHGLNASSEGEMRAWEQYVEAYQKHFYGDRIQRIIDFAQLSLFGDVDESIGYEWVPLHSLDELGEADVQYKKADTAVKLIDAGVLDPVEERRRLKADPMSGYNGIDAEAVPEGPEVDEGGESFDPGGATEQTEETAAKEQAEGSE